MISVIHQNLQKLYLLGDYMQKKMLWFLFFSYDSTKAVSLVVFLINVESYILIIAVCLEFPRILYFLKQEWGRRINF